MIESDSKYWAPNDDFGSMTYSREIWRKEGKYPPKLSDFEKRIVDRQGSYDANGNFYGVTWNLGGHPIANKTDSEGMIYNWDEKHGRYMRYTGCFSVAYLD